MNIATEYKYEGPLSAAMAIINIVVKYKQIDSKTRTKAKAGF